MKPRVLSVTTPFGTFTRKTGRAYRFVGIGAHPDRSPVAIVGAAALIGRRSGTAAPALYLARWSETEAGARRNVETYGYDTLECVGVYPVEEPA